MSRYLDYLNENSQFQNFLQYGQQEKEDYEDRKAQGLESLAILAPGIANVLERGKDVYTKGVNLYNKGKEALDKIEEGGKKVVKVVEDTTAKLGEKVEEGKGILDDAINGVKGLSKKALEIKDLTEGDLKALKNKYGSKFTDELDKLNQKKQNLSDNLKKQYFDKKQELSDKFDELKNKAQQEGRDLTEKEISDFKQKGAEILNQQKEELGNKFNSQKEVFENKFKDNFKTSGENKSQSAMRTVSGDEKNLVARKHVGSEIEPMNEQPTERIIEREGETAIKKSTSRFTRAGEQTENFFSRQSNSASKRVFDEEFDRDDVGEVGGDSRGVLFKVTSLFRGGEKGASKIPSESLNLASKEGEELSQRGQAVGKALQKSGDEFLEKGKQAGQVLQKTGNEITDQAKGAVNAIQKTGDDLYKEGKTAAQAIQKTGSEAIEEGANVGRTFSSRGASLVEGGADLARTTVTRTAVLAGDTASTLVDAGAAIGAVASEVIPIVGELAPLAYGIYDAIKSAVDRPHIYSTARPTFSAGL